MMKFIFISILLTYGPSRFQSITTAKITRKPNLNSFYTASKNDTIPISVPKGKIPLARNENGMNRPKFNTIHLALGLGGMSSDLSDLNMLGINQGKNVIIPFSVYVHVPFNNGDPPIYLSSGWNFGISGGTNSFNIMLLSQPISRIIIGAGVGRSEYIYDGNDIYIDAAKTYPLLTFGINLSPRIIDLMLMMPLDSTINTDFEGNEYSINVKRFQISLFISLTS